MNMTGPTERHLRSLLADMAPSAPPEVAFDAVMDRVSSTRQRPAWRSSSTARLDSGRVGLAGPRSQLLGSARFVVIVLVLLLIAVIGSLLASGGGLQPTPASLASPTATATATAGRSPAPARTPSHTPAPVLPGEPWILYERFTQLGGGLFVMRPDGTDSHQVMTTIPGVLKDADWSPDGARVVFIDEQTEYMWIAGIDGSNAKRIPYCDARPGCAHPAWSPDGTRIAFSVAENGSGIVGPAAVGIYVLDIASDAVTRVIRVARPLLGDVPRWSPDGTELVIGVDQMDDAATETGAAIAIVPIAGGAPRYLTSFDQFAYLPDWNRVDGSILFTVQIRELMASPPPNDTWNLFTLRPDGTGLRQVTDVPSATRLWFPTFTPDGTRILAADQGRRLAVLVDPQTGTVDAIGGSDLARPLLRPLP